jgi:hypothetical protein
MMDMFDAAPKCVCKGWLLHCNCKKVFDVFASSRQWFGVIRVCNTCFFSIHGSAIVSKEVERICLSFHLSLRVFMYVNILLALQNISYSSFMDM